MMNAWSNAYGLALGAVLATSAGPSVAAPDEFYAGRTITVKGKLAERDGIRLIENAEIVK